jgi:transcriptional regulator with XRE-family HTH domain
MFSHWYFIYIWCFNNLTAMQQKPVHEGRNVKRIREILGIKQDALAIDLGLSQQAISQLEQKEALDADMLQKIAAILKVPVEAIKNFDEDAAVNYINTFNDNSTNQGVLGSFNDHSSFILNPVEKWIEALEENKKLYERLLQSEKEKVALLEKMLK